MAALSFSVHSATTLALISFMYSMKALRGFLMWGFFSSSFFTATGDFLQGKWVWGSGPPGRAPVPTAGLALTHELPPGLALGWEGSCLTMGETMVGCGMPEGCSPCVGGGTMCGEKRLDIKLQWGERTGGVVTSPRAANDPPENLLC